jgi:hypothetical protein
VQVPTALGEGPVATLTPLCVLPTRALENHCCICYSNFRRVPPAGDEGEGGVAGGADSDSVVFCGRSAVVRVCPAMPPCHCVTSCMMHQNKSSATVLLPALGTQHAQ